MDAHTTHSADDGHLTDEGIALYVDALKLEKLSGLPQWMLDHVSECHSCKERITGLFAIVPQDVYDGLTHHPTFGALAPARTWYRIAAAIALVSIAGASTLLILGDRGEVPPQSGPTGSPDSAAVVSPVQNERQLAEAFAPEPELEGLVNFQSRSSGITLISPEIGAEIPGPVTFDWKGSAPAVIEVYNNRKELQKTFTIRRPPGVLRQNLSPGVYYWKLIAEEELLFVGKFTAR
jgi:hypothetical protein